MALQTRRRVDSCNHHSLAKMNRSQDGGDCQQQTCELDAHHDHANDPEEDDVVACLQQRCGVELLKVCRLVRPSHGGEREQARRKPRVQNVDILIHSSQM